VLLTDGLIWSGDLVRARDPGITEARDPETGEVARERPDDSVYFTPGMSHHRCYRNRATEKYVLTGRSGVELLDIATGEAVANHWIRGTCQFGVLPANGLLYVPPHSCACYLKTKLNGLNALAPERPEAGGRQGPRLVRGPAFGWSSEEKPRDSQHSDWPTYRHDAARSGATSVPVPVNLEQAWQAEIGGRLSSLTIAGGRVFLAEIDAHTVHALSTDDGQPLWSFTAGGRVDSPATVSGDLVLFGSADGHVYCLNAADGALAWRFRAGPEDRRIVVDDQLESVWPVHGSVLVQDGVVYFAAGRSSFLDGGLFLYALDSRTGEVVSESVVSGRDPATGEQPRDAIDRFDMPGGLPDVLSSDGEFVYMRDLKFDEQCRSCEGGGMHLFSPTGFLDESWWHRSYWLWGPEFKSGWPGWHQAGNTYPAGRLMVFDEETIYGFGRSFYPRGNAGQWGTGEEYRLYAASKSLKVPESRPQPQAVRRGRQPYPESRVQYKWSETIEPEARAMVLAGETLFVAGPRGETHRSLPAWLGEDGIRLQAISTVDGGVITSYELEDLPVLDGMAAAGGRLYLATKGGRVICFSER
jgi:outer membrane protein assembly factor BamB